MKKDFNRKCYEKISLIPKGMITTYAEIANSLDSNAYRAVGNAMANNPNPILVPCHRVIRSNGSLGGYAIGFYGGRPILERFTSTENSNKLDNLVSKYGSAGIFIAAVDKFTLSTNLKSSMKILPNCCCPSLYDS